MISLVQSNGSPNFHIFLSYGPHQRLKFGLIAVFSLPNNMNGLDSDYWAQNIRNITSMVHFFYKYLEIGERSTAEIWTRGRVEPSSHF